MFFIKNLQLIFAALIIIYSAGICSVTEHREIKVASANIRNGPGTEYIIMFQLGYGSLITVLEKKGDWLRIEGRNPNEIAWVYEQLTAPEGFTKISSGKEGKGKFMDYDYFWFRQEGKIIAIFSPFLPRNDTIVIGAMFDVIARTYGKHRVTNLNPEIVSRGGMNVIRFKGVSEDYLFSIIKEDTGEVHTLILWTE